LVKHRDNFTFPPRLAQDTFLFFIAPKRALELTQPLTQRVPGTVSQDIKRIGRETDLSSLSGVEIETDGVIPPLLLMF
jgi:hypothetical protein